MAFWNRRAKVPFNTFIEQELENSTTFHFETIKQGLEIIGPIPNVKELQCFVSFLPLIGMTIAGHSENVRLEYMRLTFDKLDLILGASRTKGRFKEYNLSFANDLQSNKAHIAPHLISTALENVFGSSDESNVLQHLALLTLAWKPTISVSIPFYKSLKVV